MDPIIIYGAGTIGKRCYYFCKDCNIPIEMIVDKNVGMTHQQFGQLQVEPIEALKETNTLIVLCVAADNAEIIDSLVEKYDIARSNIVHFEKYWPNMILSTKRDYCIPEITRFEQKHKVCLCESYSNSIGGVETWNIAFTEALQKCGEKIDVLSLVSGDKGNQIGRISDDGAQSFGDKALIEKIVRLLVSKLPCTLILNRIDVFLIAGNVVKEKYPKAIKLISVVHGGRANILSNFANLEKYVDHYVGVSEKWICRKLIEEYQIPAEKVSYFTCPIKIQENDLDRETNYHNTIRIGFASRITRVDRDKRMDYLIPFIILLEKEIGQYELNIAGDGDYLDELTDFIQKNGLLEKVKLHGRIANENMSAFWKKNDIYLNFSDSEGNSIAKLEAMAQGDVPILTDVSGSRDSVRDGYNGYIVSCGDLEKMVLHISELNKDRKLMKELGERAFLTIRDEYNETIMVERFMSCIEDTWKNQ